MNQFLQMLQGKKTHTTCAVIVLLLLLQWAKVVTIPPEVYGVLVALALAFLRAGVTNEIGAAISDAPPASSSALSPRTDGPGAAGKAIVGMFAGFLLLAVSAVGCKNAQLESGGAYAPIVTNAVTGQVSTNADVAFYNVELTYDLAYSSVNAVFDFERNNRAYLWSISPDIKHTLDKVRPQAVAADKEYLAARAAYIANPTPGGLTGVQEVLAKLNQILASAKAALPPNLATNLP